MNAMPQEYRLYDDLAEWWPLISPPDAYTAEARYLDAVLAAAPGPVRDVLDLGSGGGNVAAHLKAGRALTLVDLSAQMLAVSRELNPDCGHQQGDMRTIRLGRAFDAVLVHDAVDYMTTEDDLAQVIETAWAHCRPGGIGLFVPDYTAESFSADNGHGGSSEPGGRQASFREWTWDPDPDDDWIQSEYEFTLRAADGSVQVVSESHQLGAFGRETWLRLLRGAGFDLESGAELEPPAGPAASAATVRGDGTEPDDEDRPRRPRNLFIGRRPRE
jgi:SAM-dependent methyltransferase